MKKITFENIYTPGYIVYENKQYKHYHYPKMLIMYDSNFIDFKKTPSLTGFKEAANYLREFHMNKGQKHVKFYFPDNKKPTKELIDYLKEKEYEFGYMELYAIQPNQFPAVNDHPDIEIQTVTDENLEIFLELQHQQNLEYGEEFAKQKKDLHKRNFIDSNIMQIMAYYKGVPAGSVDVIIAYDTAEIDSLDVQEAFQKKGIGSRLQKFIMKEFSDKTVILVADGEDTPREMYRKQNYQYLGYKYEIQKVY